MKRACSTGLPIRCAFKQIILVRKEDCMNKKLRVWFQLIILCLGVFLPFLAGTLKAQAAELNDVITEMHLTTNSGEQQIGRAHV